MSDPMQRQVTPQQGQCRTCGYRQLIKLDGRLYSHKGASPSRERCPGSDRQPAAGTVRDAVRVRASGAPYGSRTRTQQRIEDYQLLVRRDPSMPNRVIADKLGITLDALIQMIARARRRGDLKVWRISTWERRGARSSAAVRIADYGDTCGHEHVTGVMHDECRRRRGMARQNVA